MVQYVHIDFEGYIMKIGIFGITGNPPHMGHWKAVEIAANQLDEVWISPVYNHAFGKKFLEYDLRKEMLEAMLIDFPLVNVFIKDLDKDYFEKYQNTVYSYKLLCFLKELYPQHDFKLIVGEDNFQSATWEKFYKNKEIVDEFGVIVIPDLGVHSTDIRKMLQNQEDIVQLVSPNVLKIINKNNLYKE